MTPVFENESTQQNYNYSSKKDYNIDDLLDIISEKGYKELSEEQKIFLNKYSKK